LVAVSVIPYGIRIYQGKIEPKLTSWSLWSLIGLALLLTYKSSGAGANVWPAVVGFVSPFFITVLLIRRYGGWTKPDRTEVTCLLFGLLSLGLWLRLRGSKDLSQYALYLAITADACAAIPTIVSAWKQPQRDRPFAWVFFAIGYGLATFAITEHTFANYVLPIYMFTGALCIAFPLARYRWRCKARPSEWI
jgi:hypothetical protein